MAAGAQAEVQALLAFLTREAKIPLAAALSKYNLMRQQGWTTPDAIAKSDVAALKTVFADDKVAKQVHNAAKRLSNPRKRAAAPAPTISSKHLKTEADREAELRLPESSLSVDEWRNKTIETNRAPLFLAFAYSVSRYTLPGQPISSRLSLAQAVTSAGAQSKAKYIGLTSSTAEDEGWAEGQPKLKLMGRQIAVMRRHVAIEPQEGHSTTRAGDKEPAIKADGEQIETEQHAESAESQASHEAFWGIDIEALRKSNGPLVAGKMTSSAGPPIHKPEGARAYLLKSIDLAADDEGHQSSSTIKVEDFPSPAKTKKASAAETAARKERAVAMLLKSIDYVCSSWASALTADELDRRANVWYAKVRPEVEGGQAGWGQRGKVSLKAILDFARDAS